MLKKTLLTLVLVALLRFSAAGQSMAGVVSYGKTDTLRTKAGEFVLACRYRDSYPFGVSDNDSFVMNITKGDDIVALDAEIGLRNSNYKGARSSLERMAIEKDSYHRQSDSLLARSYSRDANLIFYMLRGDRKRLVRLLETADPGEPRRYSEKDLQSFYTRLSSHGYDGLTASDSTEDGTLYVRSGTVAGKGHLFTNIDYTSSGKGLLIEYGRDMEGSLVRISVARTVGRRKSSSELDLSALGPAEKALFYGLGVSGKLNDLADRLDDSIREDVRPGGGMANTMAEVKAVYAISEYVIDAMRKGGKAIDLIKEISF